ncbi:MAG: deoxyhypusine synthase [Candidatus Lokiarchaeota archaeon]|nr:deoxyhypusine synthase [Candidatus Lokiarchaeota archaeon]MBD3341024.1 deoxyhypusine synthase [Candidatus Lokiarchaeota archaeon]
MEEHQNNDYLIRKVAPFDVYKIKNIEDLLSSLKNCGFQGRNLGKALDILYKMVKDEAILTVMTLSGAMVPAGMGDLICALLERKLIDVLITTGANIIHDLVDVASDIGHYVGSPDVSDEELFEQRINRIYDTFLPENNYKKAEDKLFEIIRSTFKEKEVFIKPSELLKRVGEKLDNRCILSTAAKNDVPIFVPAFTDSEFTLNLIKYSVREGYRFTFDTIGDVMAFADIIRSSEEYGTFIIGGGVPRNWAQQIFPLLDQIDQIETMGYNYSVRIHTATEYDGGLSGCTISESKSWGKYSLESKYVSVWCDATIALPILVTGLFQKLNII